MVTPEPYHAPPDISSPEKEGSAASCPSSSLAGEEGKPPASSVFRRVARAALRWLGRGLFAAYLFFIALVLILRYGILPEIHRYQGDIEATASRALGLPVSIGHLQARWTGLNPALVLNDVRIANREGAPALTLERVEGILSWRSLFSLWHGEPQFASLELKRPSLQIRRNAQGEIFVAGLAIAGSGEGSGLRWLLAQSRIRILDATLAWEDETRQAPPLILEDVQFELQNREHRHHFGFSALPPAAFASRLDIRGDLRGGAKDAMTDWQGTVYTALDYADLSIWNAWVDYPVALPQGQGGIRLWIERKEGAWSGVADLALRDLRLRLKPELPELDLQTLDGRLRLTQSPGALEIATQQLRLKTRDGLQLTPLDLTAEWQGKAGEAGHGALKANRLDLHALARLAAYLPLDATRRKLLEAHQPQGLVEALDMSWDARDGEWKKYSIKAAFSGLGLKAQGLLPGARGLAGHVEADETEGRLTLETQASRLSFPAVFAEPDTPLTELRAEVSWKPEAIMENATENKGIALDLDIKRLDFKSPYANGQLSGRYRSAPGEPGVIDLQGSLSQAKATEVWRYIPKKVNANVPAWLRQGLLSGTGHEARLILKGDLKHFPFRDPDQGQFQITVKASNAALYYGEHWPVIEDIEADLSFGAGMKIEAHKGRILGAQLEKAIVEIPDFGMEDPMLRVHGHVMGATSEFLDFIEQSPVADKIDHFTQGMTAQGQGRLELELDLPLKHVRDTRVTGNYTFASNLVSFMPDLPPVSQVEGRLDFTDHSMGIENLRGHFLGQPMHLSARSEKDAVHLKASGGLTAQALRRQFNWPLLEHLSGSSDWQIDMKLKKNVDFLLTANLQGLASSLPPPFGKSADLRMPLRLQKIAQNDRNGPQREHIAIHLGDILASQLQRRKEGNAFVLERGVIGIGQAAAMPDNGLNLFITQEKLDLDTWRRLLQDKGKDAGNASVGASLPFSLIAINAQELTFLGRPFAEVGIRLTPDARESASQRWRIMLASQEAVGELTWDGSDKNGKEGRITAHLKRLHLAANDQDAPTGSATVDAALAPENLPGMDIQVENLNIGNRRFGRLELKADNAGGYWNLRQILIDNPDGRLTGSGKWEVGTVNQRTFLDFDLAVANSEKLLERLGYPGMVRGGTAQLNGKLNWAGAPSALDAATLDGSLQLQAAKGQFSKVEPGVGKLLGLLSLQSITRRLSLDFHDVFSNGFAYDNITARIHLRHGVMETDGDLKIDGPAGEILMRGTADMKSETQNLNVTVQPELGGIAAVGVAIAINPVVGAATLLAQNVLKNPLNKAFSLQYKVTGTWDNPQVEKIGMTGVMPGAMPETRPENAAPETGSAP
jgi:uncharacterized protein (TIGR02099 family)